VRSKEEEGDSGCIVYIGIGMKDAGHHCPIGAGVMLVE
jgi:hypothetical protein